MTVGVEEEFLLVDAVTRRPAPDISKVLGDVQGAAGDYAQSELHQAQIEGASPPCHTLDELRAELTNVRIGLVEAAHNHGASVVASGTYPATMGRSGMLITANQRYESMAHENRQPAREQLICGCHIHVSVPDPELAIRAMNRARRWLPCLLALTANSPFWEAQDTGFDSYRTEVWSRWPVAGPPGAFDSVDSYHELVDQLVGCGAILSRAMAYWDIRPSERYPTLEIRVADVSPFVDNAVVVAALARALIMWCLDQPDEPPPLRPELLRAANWMAARSGLSGMLIDPLDGTSAPARVCINQLLNLLGPSLDAMGDRKQVIGLTMEILMEGNGAVLQRRAFDRRHQMVDVIDAVTLSSSGLPTSLSFETAGTSPSTGATV